MIGGDRDEDVLRLLERQSGLRAAWEVEQRRTRPGRRPRRGPLSRMRMSHNGSRFVRLATPRRRRAACPAQGASSLRQRSDRICRVDTERNQQLTLRTLPSVPVFQQSQDAEFAVGAAIAEVAGGRSGRWRRRTGIEPAARTGPVCPDADGDVRGTRTFEPSASTSTPATTPLPGCSPARTPAATCAGSTGSAVIGTGAAPCSSADLGPGLPVKTGVRATGVHLLHSSGDTFAVMSTLD